MSRIFERFFQPREYSDIVDFLAGIGNNRQYEISNGAASLATIAFLVFLFWYLVREWRARELGISDILHLPLGMRVAVAIMIADVGNLLVRAPVWYLRAFGGMATNLTSVMVLVGTAIFAIGMLCKIRVFSEEHLGHAPWIVTGCAVGIFVGYRIAT